MNDDAVSHSPRAVLEDLEVVQFQFVQRNRKGSHVYRGWYRRSRIALALRQTTPKP